MQAIVEKNIKELSEIDEDVLGEDNIFDLRFLALQVKVGELANLTKCYKYSKMKEDIPKDKLIIRYIDALQFLLSIGNINHFNIIDKDAIRPKRIEESLIKSFGNIYDDIKNLKDILQQGNYLDSLTIYIRLFAEFINLGHLLGFSFEEIYEFYSKMAHPVSTTQES